MSKRINPSWERPRGDEVHSPEGLDALKTEYGDGMRRFYYTLAETMFRYDGMDTGRFEQMNIMSRDTMPERWLLDNGECCVFDLFGSAEEPDAGGPLVCLPFVMKGGVNIYGQPNQWNAVPVGWDDTKGPANPEALRRIHDRVLSYDDSVIIRNDRISGPDKGFIDTQVAMLLDNILTVNQLQLLLRSPYVYRTRDTQVVTARNHFLTISRGEPVIFEDDEVGDIQPVIENTGVRVDPAIFEIADRVECNILSYLGFPCIPVTKRAQQSVSEVQSNDDRISVRRHDRLQQRERAIARINRMFGTDVRVVSVIDEAMDDMAAEAKAEQDGIRGDKREP